MRFLRLRNAVLGISLLTVAGFVSITVAPLAHGQNRHYGRYCWNRLPQFNGGKRSGRHNNGYQFKDWLRACDH